jgi:FkbM family methyltransferase
MFMPLAARLSTLTHRPDFRAHPVKASAKRAFYHARWRVRDSPWSLSFLDDYTLDVPKGGCGALIYYQGLSEPPVAAFITRYLKPGMTFVDVGAHFGEYSVLASSLVGSSGSVHAFEPAPMMFGFLQRNIEQNRLWNVHAHDEAVGDHNGEISFTVCAEPGLSRLMLDGHGLRPGTSREEITVPVIRLDEWARTVPTPVALIKADIEGVELLALRGAEGLMRQPDDEAPAWIFEYEPASWADFGHTIEAAHDFLTSCGYGLYAFTEEHGIFPIRADEAFEASRAFGTDLLALKPAHVAAFA